MVDLGLFEKVGNRVSIANNGYEAIDLYQKAQKDNSPFDLVILDLTIPGSLGGKETFKLLKQQFPGIKCIVSSGYSEDPVLANYLDYGYLGVLNKPYTFEELQSLLTIIQ